jgi:hypothetical protein
MDVETPADILSLMHGMDRVLLDYLLAPVFSRRFHRLVLLPLPNC